MEAGMIEVTQREAGDPMEFEVVVSTGGSESRHRVTMSAEDQARLGAGHDPAAVIEAAFRFLLDREPKEAILGRFDIDVIPTYFPDFEETLPTYLGRS